MGHMNKSRQAYIIIEEQMKSSHPLYAKLGTFDSIKIRDMSDIKEWIRFQKTLVKNVGLTHIIIYRFDLYRKRNTCKEA